MRAGFLCDFKHKIQRLHHSIAKIQITYELTRRFTGPIAQKIQRMFRTKGVHPIPQPVMRRVKHGIF
jgi:hypothetical protein